jgi:hypothetical protein
MNGWQALDRFLRTDPRDVGCAEAMDLLHVYAELVAAGADAEQRYPGIAAHLRACGPCGEDFEGLLAAVRSTADPGETSELPRPSDKDRLSSAPEPLPLAAAPDGRLGGAGQASTVGACFGAVAADRHAAPAALVGFGAIVEP